MKTRGKTFDGVKLTKIVRMLDDVGANIRQGGKHKLVAKYNGTQYSCALGPSTGVKKHLLPWMKKALKEDYNPSYVNDQLGICYA